MVSPMSETETTPYRVLARKYRPKDFSSLIGQEAMVRTLTNAIASGRLAHAFVLTGVRGVGKTTTARIIARALNCIGADGQSGPTIEPCGLCAHCRDIAEDRHVDVMEMDAASRTGVDGIREIIDGVRYRPVSARFKVYIIDEVHMLSTNAFNALLKTLEEPPEHVKFIFATTELRKIPVTVLSRCQRFDLRRVEMEVLTAHFARIAKDESATVDEGALRLIARAADGSVRDGLSLLDQAISHGDGTVTETQMRDMLGLADRARIFDLFEAVLSGDVAQALNQLEQQYQLGADPAVVTQDLLELTHWITRLKLTPDAAQSFAIPETERVRGSQMAEKLAMPHLSRSWQMLLKGLGEIRQAPNPLQACEMLLIRLAYVTDLPTPAEAIEQARSAPSGGGAGPGGRSAAPTAPTSIARHPVYAVDGPRSHGGAALALQPASQPAPLASLPPMPQSFAEVVAMAQEKREGILSSQLRHYVRVVHFEVGKIECRVGDDRSLADLPQRLSRALGDWTGRRWVVTLNNTDQAQPTLVESAAEADRILRDDATNHPLIQAILEAFPGATVGAVRDLTPALMAESPTADHEAPDSDMYDSEMFVGDDDL
jgi:DNA polymerase III subunit gamma/tau